LSLDARVLPATAGNLNIMSLTRSQALDLLRSDDLIGLGMEADSVRRRFHPGNVVTYQIDRNINYTNICTEYCSFCAFYRPVGSAEGYVQPLESIFQKIDETLALGGTGILMQGGLHPDLKIDYYEGLLSTLKSRYPRLHLHCLSAPEVLNIAEVSGLSLADTLSRLRDAGLDSIPGAGAEILDDEVRFRIARLKCSTEEWLAVHRAAHRLGLRTTATMMFGCGETIEHRVNHFERLWQLHTIRIVYYQQSSDGPTNTLQPAAKLAVWKEGHNNGADPSRCDGLLLHLYLSVSEIGRDVVIVFAEFVFCCDVHL